MPERPPPPPGGGGRPLGGRPALRRSGPADTARGRRGRVPLRRRGCRARRGSGRAGDPEGVTGLTPRGGGIIRRPWILFLIVTNLWGLTERRHVDLCRVASQACR
ncbi:putative leader peptide [Nocardiopsis potens]|uniref:putative leader peptide n=1 Tax=Nocardiopsis potens TaxID=1246458 RepID=UPI00373AE6A5